MTVIKHKLPSLVINLIIANASLVDLQIHPNTVYDIIFYKTYIVILIDYWIRIIFTSVLFSSYVLRNCRIYIKEYNFKDF
jgi:hypothetical protein